MIVAMQREGKTAFEIADFYTDAFLKDVGRLNIKPAHTYPRATKHIQEQIDMVTQLEKNGFAYTTSDGVYFDTSKLESYGRLSGQSLDEKLAGARVDIGEKKQATDFALWKFSPEGVKRDMEWESPWGVGFPGWHIECSAMSVKYLEAPFDIHTGGIDHISVHHENELAQTEGALGVDQANVWMHGEFLTVDGGKMGKSLGNLFTVDQLVEKDVDPIAFRYFVLGAHYRTQLNFTFEALEASGNALKRLRGLVRDWSSATDGGEEFDKRFDAALFDDLNTAQALAVMWDLVDSDIASGAKAKSLLRMDSVFGFGLELYVGVALEIPEDVLALVKEREGVRVSKDWARSDELRDEILEKGYVVEDAADGSKLSEK